MTIAIRPPIVTLSRERFTDIFAAEAMPLFARHWRELANYQQVRPLEVDVRAYIALETKGILRWYTLRHWGLLLGYVSFATLPSHLHYRGWAHALADTFWVAPEYGNRAFGYLRLFRYADVALKADGFRSITYHARHRKRMAAVFRRLGYAETETLWEKLT